MVTIHSRRIFNKTQFASLQIGLHPIINIDGEEIAKNVTDNLHDARFIFRIVLSLDRRHWSSYRLSSSLAVRTTAVPIRTLDCIINEVDSFDDIILTNSDVIYICSSLDNWKSVSK